MALGKVRKAEKYKRNWKLFIGRALSLADSPLYAFYVGKRFRDDINVKSDVKLMMHRCVRMMPMEHCIIMQGRGYDAYDANVFLSMLCPRNWM